MTRQEHIENLKRAIAREERSLTTLYSQLDIGSVVGLQECNYEHMLRLDKQKIRKANLTRLLSKPS